MRTLIFIPAKGKSSRLPGKNTLLLRGKPLVAWTAEAARASGVEGDIVVSTEEPAVAAIARALGLEVIDRPEELARDSAGVVHVALHALSELRRQGREYQRLVILLPTSPLRTGEDIQNAVKLFEEKKAEFLLSVSRFDHPPYSALTLEDGLAKPLFPEYLGKASQQMPVAYRPNGAIHILSVKAFEKTRNYVSQPLFAYVMPWPRSIDVDTEGDLRTAEAVLTDMGK